MLNWFSKTRIGKRRRRRQGLLTSGHARATLGIQLLEERLALSTVSGGDLTGVKLDGPEEGGYVVELHLSDDAAKTALTSFDDLDLSSEHSLLPNNDLLSESDEKGDLDTAAHTMVTGGISFDFSLDNNALGDIRAVPIDPPGVEPDNREGGLIFIGPILDPPGLEGVTPGEQVTEGIPASSFEADSREAKHTEGTPEAAKETTASRGRDVAFEVALASWSYLPGKSENGGQSNAAHDVLLPVEHSKSFSRSSAPSPTRSGDRLRLEDAGRVDAEETRSESSSLRDERLDATSASSAITGASGSLVGSGARTDSSDAQDISTGQGGESFRIDQGNLPAGGASENAERLERDGTTWSRVFANLKNRGRLAWPIMLMLVADRLSGLICRQPARGSYQQLPPKKPTSSMRS